MTHGTRAQSSPAPRIGGHYSRRDFLRVLAVGCVAGSVAGCATSSATKLVPTATPTAPVPRTPITPGNAPTLVQLALLRPEDGRVRGLAWSPDGQRLATGSNRFLQLWDTATGQQMHSLAGHTDQINSLAWSPASNLLVSVSFDGTARVWDPQQARVLQVLASPQSTPLFSVAWSPDGEHICAGTMDGNVLRWNVRSGEQSAVWSGPPKQQRRSGRYPFAVWGVSWSPDGRRIVSTRYDDLLLIWEVATGASQAIPKTDSQPNTVAWAPDANTFAVTDDAGAVSLWDGVTLRRSTTFAPADEAGWSYGLAWAPAGDLLASGRESGAVQLWGVPAGQALATLQAHAAAVWALAWSPDRLRLASGSDDATVRLWGILSPA